MKISKAELRQLIGASGSCDWNCDLYMNDRFKSRVLTALSEDKLDIEGYERVQWTKFDPNDPKTFPPKGKDQFLTLSNDGEIRSMHFDFDTSLEWKHYISHWRPRPNLPVEMEQASLSICGVTTTLTKYELIHLILQKTLQGQELYAKGEFTPPGHLLPHRTDMDPTQKDLTHSLLVRIMTNDGMYIIECGALTHIDTSPIPPNVEKETNNEA